MNAHRQPGGIVWYLMGLMAAFWSGCATIQSPDGGPKDSQPPHLVQIDPPNETRNLKPIHIKFTFDEFLKSTELSNKVFISPLLEPAPVAYAQNKHVHIRMPNPLPDTTTYVITLFEGIKDDNEGNALATPIRYAFSTGANLDQGRIEGRVIDAFSGKPASGWLVALYDTLVNANYRNIKPLYASQTDAGGQFELMYIKEGTYRILSFDDKDRNFRLSQSNEGLAFLDNDLIKLDSTVSNLVLRGFQPDEEAPKLKNIIRPNPYTLVLEFNEVIEGGVILEYKNKSDTLKQHPNGPANRLYAAWTETNPRDSIELLLRSVIDTVGNRRDTIYRMKWPASQNDSTFSLSRLDTVKEARRRMWMSNAPLDSLAIKKAIRVLTPDSVPIAYAFQFEAPFRFGIKLKNVPDTIHTVLVTVDSTLKSVDGLKLNTIYSEKWNTKEFSKLGRISGNIVGSYNQQTLIELYNYNSKEKLCSQDKEFNFVELTPAPYQIRILFDDDNNRRWTPGRLIPRRMPEFRIAYPELINLKPGAEIENIEINLDELLKQITQGTLK